MSVATRKELQDLVELFYKTYVYDNFSPDYEREISKNDFTADSKGGNCVYLSRLFLEYLRTDARFESEKCQLLVARKHAGGNCGKPLNHVLVLYDNFVVELAGASSGIVCIGSDYELHQPIGYLYKAIYNDDDKNLIQVFRMKASGMDIGQQNPIDASVLHQYSAHDGDKPHIQELKKSIRDTQEGRYQVRYATGQTMIILKIVKVDDVVLPFHLQCGIGRYSKKKADRYIAPPSPLPGLLFSTAKEDWNCAVRLWLEGQLGTLATSINVQNVLDSLSQWLLK